jgi:hypothetical protein
VKEKTQPEKQEIIAEELMVACVAMVAMHGVLSASGPMFNAKVVWELARNFVDEGKKALKVDLIQELAKR